MSTSCRSHIHWQAARRSIMALSSPRWGTIVDILWWWRKTQNSRPQMTVTKNAGQYDNCHLYLPSARALTLSLVMATITPIDRGLGRNAGCPERSRDGGVWKCTYGVRLMQVFLTRQPPCAAILPTVWRRQDQAEMEAKLGTWTEGLLVTGRYCHRLCGPAPCGGDSEAGRDGRL
jgi:hypothetical protein